MVPSAIPRTFRDQSQARNRRDSVKITWMSKYDRHSLSANLSELNVQRRVTKLILKLPFSPLINLLNISQWHEFPHILSFFNPLNNSVFEGCEVLPVTRQLTIYTRSWRSNAFTYIPKRSRTVTY